ncbi:DUF456 domain-containing protein [Paenibacillus physcomitrellae]|uniref:DUF456 domain-containing protein n=1 Tax=Paenibacillus physcomitrellae TaxID=1619311 RepID=A0ABQ1G3H7_9BACL|nr:DUF456 family protein [Paenibacillus physcomitrellae]GGA35224.1 hypothetical protein GCM10010917_20540 [Paenibacillus physcomitrellae]
MWLDVIGWILVIALFVTGLAGAIVPVLPGVVAVYAAFFVYGGFFGFQHFGWVFWSLQSLIVVVLLVADYLVGAWGVKRFGGSKASVWLSTIGAIIGPFVIPAFGLVIGPFVGAVIGELLTGAGIKQSLKAGVGSVVGLFSSMAVKIILQIVMIVVFFIWIFSF